MSGSIGVDLRVIAGDAATTYIMDNVALFKSVVPGPEGPEGSEGDKGDSVTLVSAVNNPLDGTFTLTFSDGTVHITEDLRGVDGEDGIDGLKGDAGESVTVDSIVMNGDYTLTVSFSDGYEYTTERSIRGADGRNIHHIVHTSSQFANGDIIAGIGYAENIGDPEMGPGKEGVTDTYQAYADEEENTHVGEIVVTNGQGAYAYAVAGGYTGTEEEFNISLSSITDIETASQLAQWRAEANEMTTDSFANEPVDTEVSIYISNDDGTFTGTVQPDEYSALHYKTKTNEDYLKTLGLGNGYMAADIAARDLLEGLTTADTVFVSDDGDGKWARYQVIAVTDGLGSTSTFEKIMDEDTYLNANTAEDIKATYESNADTNAFTDAEKVKLAATEITSQLDARDIANRSTDNHVDGVVNGVYTLAERLKLSNVETGATADQTAVEIEALYEGLSDTNKYTDAEKARLSNTESTTQLNTRDTDNRNADNHTDGTINGVYTLAERQKLDAIEDDATADQTGAEIKVLYEAEDDTNAFTDAEKLLLAVTAKATGTDTLTRHDKILGSKDIIEMVYSTTDDGDVAVGDLVTVVYEGDDGSSIYYRDVLSYIDYDLSEVKHFNGTINTTTESGKTTLTYVGGNLATTEYEEN